MNFRVEKTLNLKSKRSSAFYGSRKYLTTNLIHFINWSLYIPSITFFVFSQVTFTCSKSTIEMQGVKYV